MIEVIRLKDGGLEREVWEFIDLNQINKTTLVLERYKLQTRKTKRYGWTTGSAWSWHKWDRRFTNMKKDAVPLPEDVKREVIEEFVKEIRVLKI